MIVDRFGRPLIREYQREEFREIAWADPLHLFADQPTQYNPNILVTRKGLRIFDQIRRDDQVKAALSFKKHALMSTGWHLESPAGKPDDWEPTVFIEEQLNALEGTFKESLLQILTALDYGYSVSEKIHEGEGSQVNLAAIKTRAPHSIEFATDEYGNLLPDGIMQTDRGDAGNVYMPRLKFVLLQYQKEFGNPYGTSDLDASYRGWWGKDNAYKWMMMLLERHGVPPIFALYNSARYKGASLTELQNIISALQATTTGTIPRSDEKDLELWAPELAGQISSVFIPAMKMLNEDLARSILMPGLMGLTPEQSTGSLARARVTFDVFILVVDFLRTTVEERVVDEQIIRPLVAMNFPVDEFPTFHFNPLTEDSRTELLKAWAELVGASAVLNTKDDEDHIRQLLEFPEREGEEPTPEPEDEPEMEPEPEDEPEIGELAQFAALTGREPEGEPIRRQKTEAEKSVNFQEIDRRLEKMENVAVQSLVGTIKAIQTTMTNRLRKTGPSVAVPKVMPGQKADIQSALKTLTDSVARFGSNTVRQELPKQMQEPVTASPVEAIQYLDQKDLWITEVLTENLVNEARAAMLKSIELGETTQAAMERLREVFLPYIGSGQIRVEGRLLTPHRIETIVRTNTTDAFNKGRLTEIMRPEYDDIVDYVMYSAIRDTRTTAVCRKLDGLSFRRDDPALQSLSPPRHFQALSRGTKITTRRGDIPIETVQVGDEVWTHRGRWRKVYSVMSKQPDVPQINELTLSTGRVLRITDEHPVLTSTGWSRAEDLDVGDVLFQDGKQVPGSIDMIVASPDDYPSLFDEEPVAYDVVRLAGGRTLTRINLDGDLALDVGEVDDVSVNGIQETEGSPCFNQDRGHLAFGGRWVVSPSLGGCLRSALRGTLRMISVVLLHSLAVAARPIVSLFASPVGPVPIAASLGNGIRMLVGDGSLLDSGSDLDAESLAGHVQGRFPESYGPLDGPDRLAAGPMSALYQVNDGAPIGEVDVHSKSPCWCGAAIIMAAKIPCEETLWNLAVEEDETYLAEGLVVHNCRSILVPLGPEIEVDRSDIVDTKTAAQAKELSGKGFK